MDMNYDRRLIRSFIRVFAVLFVLIVMMPWLLDLILHYISGGVSPGNDSIKVFKDFVADKAALVRFIDALKKIFIFM